MPIAYHELECAPNNTHTSYWSSMYSTSPFSCLTKLLSSNVHVANGVEHRFLRPKLEGRVKTLKVARYDMYLHTLKHMLNLVRPEDKAVMLSKVACKP